MMEENLEKIEDEQFESDVKEWVFTSDKRLPSKSLIDRYARLYMAGFNQPPWDIYEYNYTPEKAREEFALLVSTALSSGGALISLRYLGKPAGFSVVIGLDIFYREFQKNKENQKKPPHYHSPSRYFARLAQLLKRPRNEFHHIGYIADVVIDERYRGQGFGNMLISTSVWHLKNIGKKYALAWTVNPAMNAILKHQGFELLEGIGDKGEGIDFTAHQGAWYPTLAQTAKSKDIQVIALHYIKSMW
jgi:ribosomal protein S18 acetylase RimI-like enzyme